MRLEARQRERSLSNMPTRTETDPSAHVVIACNSSTEAAIHLIFEWYQCCFCHGMTNLFTHTDDLDEHQEDVLPAHAARKHEGIGVIVYSPMASGLLTGAMTRARIAGLPDDDWRKGNPDFNEPRLSTNLALVSRLRGVGKLHGYSPGAVAVAWTLRHAAVTGAIVGARKPEQVDDVVAAAAFDLTTSDLAEIESVTELAGRFQ
jgi:aryl-alcohol dehydrogenase-like predicted oxidoreductase